MLSKNGTDIINDVEATLKNKDVDSLLQKYSNDETKRVFIQKYIETKIATSNDTKTTISLLSSFLAVLAALMLNIYSIFFPEKLEEYQSWYVAILILLMVTFFITFVVYIYELFKQEDAREDIIVAIEDAKLENLNEESHIIPNPEIDKDNGDTMKSKYKAAIFGWICGILPMVVVFWMASNYRAHWAALNIFTDGILNWDAINTMSNIFLVLALVCITAWYANEVKKQTELMLKPQRRPKILDEIQNVLTPAINHLDWEIKAIENKNIFWHRYSEGCEFTTGLSKLFHDPPYGSIYYSYITQSNWALKDILEKFPELNGLFSSHNSFIDELNELYMEIEPYIMTQEIGDTLKEMTKEFNKLKDGLNTLVGSSINEPERYFGEYIINKYATEHPADIVGPQIDFWDENKNELLKFRDVPQIIEIDKNIVGILDQLKKLNEAIFETLNTIRDECRMEYNITDNEVEPFKAI